MKVIVILFALGCCAQASVLSLFNRAPETKELDRVRTADWVDKFYDQCGRRRNFDENDLGNYEGLEVSKKCIGDRDDCIENRNCYFAVAIEETFRFQKDYEGSTPAFVDYTRSIVRVDVTLLDTCHLHPLPDGQDKTDKFVGLSFGTLLPNRTLRCDNFQEDYNIDNFRAFFFVKDFSQCTIMPDTPVHPFYRVGEINVTITNHITILPNTWQTMCNNIMETIPATASFANNEDFLKYLTMTYYGTPGFTAFNNNPINSDFSYADDAAFVDNSRGLLRLGPKAEDRKIVIPDASGSPTFHTASLLSSFLVAIPLFKSVL